MFVEFIDSRPKRVEAVLYPGLLVLVEEHCARDAREDSQQDVQQVHRWARVCRKAGAMSIESPIRRVAHSSRSCLGGKQKSQPGGRNNLAQRPSTPLMSGCERWVSKPRDPESLWGRHLRDAPVLQCRRLKPARHPENQHTQD